MQTNKNEIKKEDIKQEVFDLYDDYAHNRLDRRDFMQKLSFYAGNPTITSSSLYFSYSCSSSAYWGVFPHLEAVLTIMIFFPLNLEKSMVPP